MAFNIANIYKLAELDGVSWFDYRTTDTTATVEGANYFANYAKFLDVADKILVKSSDNLLWYTVTAVTVPVNIQGITITTAAASVTISRMSVIPLIPSGTITNAMLADMAEGTVKGRVSTGTGVPEDIPRGQLPATATNDSATTGRLGEYVSSIIQVGSLVALTSTVAANVTSISLTAGDWDVWVNAVFTGSGTGVTLMIASISTTSAANDTNVPNFGAVPTYGGVSIGAGNNCVAGIARKSISATTTYFFVAQSNFTGGTVSAYGSLQARRVR